MIFTIEEICKSTKGTLVQGEPYRKIKGVSIHSKNIKKGELFIAIKGGRFDGHKFIKESVRWGAAAVLVSKDVWSCKKDIPVIRVRDTTKALGDLARAYRKRFAIPVFAITGSAGKTTTKDLVVAVLRSKYKVLSNKGTENNRIGVPLTLFQLRPAHDIAVLELGTNRPGDIQWLTHISCPTLAMMTNIGESHLELLKTPQSVFKEKFHLVQGMDKGGVIFYNADDRYLRNIPRLVKGHRTVAFAVDHKADYQASDIQMVNNRQLSFCVKKRMRVSLQSPVISNVYNALAAISCGRFFNISYNDINRNIYKYRFLSRRQNVKKYGAYWLINDCYNANPVSFRSALKTLSDLKVKGRKILVCADMLELGKRSAELHRKIGDFVARDKNIDLVLSFGDRSRNITQQAKRSSPQLQAFHCKDLSSLHRRLKNFCKPDDAILVKGSRGMHMERTVNFLVNTLF